ncbi:hypothetical protein L1S35_01375 [Flavobacterium sp. AS60]|uniref:HYC_CC_PP family protein n=1 Tax=Flavobacterium anseongense TaxID=2910677 RepID=UPI001F40D249|nr:hypothetical protein [Flavobacterium sp. AS60]MCF6128306.1 hypothetical protein [Flavobacterium sp. AS60]
MIFKKHISILLTTVLLVSNLGLAFNVHYCDDEIASITINEAPTSLEKVDECCGIVEKDSKCCNDKVIKAEIKSDQVIVKSISFDVEFIPVLHDWKPAIFVSKNNFKQRDTITYYCDPHAPPLYLLYSQYTFYA